MTVEREVLELRLPARGKYAVPEVPKATSGTHEPPSAGSALPQPTRQHRAQAALPAPHLRWCRWIRKRGSSMTCKSNDRNSTLGYHLDASVSLLHHIHAASSCDCTGVCIARKLRTSWMKPPTETASARMSASIPAASHRVTAPALPSSLRRCRRCILPLVVDRSMVASDDRSIFRRCPNAAAVSARSTLASGPRGDSCSSLGDNGTTLISDLQPSHIRDV